MFLIFNNQMHLLIDDAFTRYGVAPACSDAVPGYKNVNFGRGIGS